jgi:hypothetical protein
MASVGAVKSEAEVWSKQCFHHKSASILRPTAKEQTSHRLGPASTRGIRGLPNNLFQQVWIPSHKANQRVGECRVLETILLLLIRRSRKWAKTCKHGTEKQCSEVLTRITTNEVHQRIHILLGISIHSAEIL